MEYVRQHGLEGLETHLRGDGIRLRVDGMPDRRTVVGKALDPYEDELQSLKAMSQSSRISSRQMQSQSQIT